MQLCSSLNIFGHFSSLELKLTFSRPVATAEFSKCAGILSAAPSEVKIWGFPGGASNKGSTCQYSKRKRCGFHPWIVKIPWSRNWQPTMVFLPGIFHCQRSLVGYSPWSHKESDMTEWLSTHIGKLSPSTDHNYTPAKTNTKTLGLSTLSSTWNHL